MATKYHDIVGLLDTHLNQNEVDVMIKGNKTFFQNFQEPLLIPSQTRGILVLIRKSCPFSLISSCEVTPNCLSVKLVSASNQELEIAFVYNPNDELEKIRNLKAAVTHLAGNGCLNPLIIGDFNSSMNRDLDYVGYGSQDPHHASREFLFGLQEDDVFIDVYRFLYPYDLSYTWKKNDEQRSRIDIALANQNLISGVTGMKHTWNQRKYSDHAMVTVVVDFETIDKGYGLFKCPSELHNDVNYQAIIKSTILKCLIEEIEESDEKYHHLNLVDRKLWEEYALTNHRQTPGKNGFEATERLLLSNIENLSNSLPTIDDLVPMTVVNHKAIHEFILQKCKEQTMTFTKKFKLRGNSPQINKLKTELTRLINNGGDNGEEILSLEDQIQLLTDEDVEKALQNRKNFRILEDERPSKSFLNLENAKRGYNEVMLVKKENTDFNPNLPESQDNLKHVEVKDRQGINDEFHRAFQKIYVR